jgi:hypothetical protein
MKLDDITFDESDKNLFQVDDVRLRADALRHSLLPRLHFLMNECITTVRQVYNVEVLEDSIVSYYPHFRQKRERELGHLYEAAYVGLGGRRTENKWHGFERSDGKEVQIVPFRFGLYLSEEGLSLFLENYWGKMGLTDSSYKNWCAITPILYYDGEELPPLSTFQEHYQFMQKHRLFANHFGSETPRSYPILLDALKSTIEHYALFYPVYDSYVQIAKGKPPRFKELIAKANHWLSSANESEETAPGSQLIFSDQDHRKAREAAEQRVKVMPAIRWQVFQRDQWKCVACGRGAQDDIILQVDHIVPRSKGGKDTLNNFQTLCHVCNSGKSNRDATDLRTER